MTNNNVELSLKITADSDGARENINALSDAVKSASKQATENNTHSLSAQNELLAAQNRAIAATYAAMKAEEKRASTFEASQKAALNEAKATEKLHNELDQLLGSIDPVIKKLSELDAKEEKLRKTYKSGAIDKETFDDFFGKINDQREAVGNVEKLSAHTKNLGLNSQTARREMFSMFRGLRSGNLSLVGNNLFQLGNITGKLPPLFSLTTLSFVALGAAAYSFSKVISSIITEQDKFNKSLISTGSYAGTTTAGLESISKTVGEINHNYSETRSVIAELAESGQLSADSIQNISTASAYMSAVTGKSAKESIASFKGIQDSVSNWALDTNKQYHFLDLATYNRIAALETQGKTEEAIAIATGKYADEMKTRANRMKEELNWLESAWEGFKTSVSEAANGIKSDFKALLGLSDINEKIANLEKLKTQIEGIKTASGQMRMSMAVSKWSKSDEEELTKLKEKKRLLEAEARLESEKAKIQASSINAQKELDAFWKSNSSEIDKQKESVEKIRKEYEALWKTVEGRKSLELKGVSSSDGKTFQGGQFDADVKSITDKEIKQYNQELSKTLAMGKEKSTLEKTEFEISQGRYQNASKGEKEIALALAKQVDALKSKKELQDRIAANNKANLELQKQLQQLLVGTNVNDQIVDDWYDNLLRQFKKSGNNKGIDLIDELLPLKKAQSNLTQITNQIQKVKDEQLAKEQSIQAQAATGLITQIEAQSQLVELHKETGRELESYLPALEEIATMPGEVGRDGQKAVAALSLEVANLNKTTDALTNAFRNGLQDGISSSLKSLADGTQDLNEALRNLTLSIVNSMADVAAQGLSSLAMDGLDNLTGSGGETAASVAGATEMGTAITTASTVGAGEFATTLGTAFTLGAELMSTAITTASAGSAGAGAAAAAFATGGFVSGAGTGTSDSIPARLSNGEYVINAAAVRRIGVPYLHQINRRQIKPFSTGGFAGRAPKLPDTDKNAVQSSGSTNIQQTLVLDAGEVLDVGLKSVAGARALMTVIRANAPTIKQMLG